MSESRSVVAWKRTDEVGEISKGQDESLGVMDLLTIHYHNCGISWVVHTGQNLLNCIL